MKCLFNSRKEQIYKWSHTWCVVFNYGDLCFDFGVLIAEQHRYYIYNEFEVFS